MTAGGGGEGNLLGHQVRRVTLDSVQREDTRVLNRRTVGSDLVFYF